MNKQILVLIFNIKRKQKKYYFNAYKIIYTENIFQQKTFINIIYEINVFRTKTYENLPYLTCIRIETF